MPILWDLLWDAFVEEIPQSPGATNYTPCSNKDDPDIQKTRCEVIANVADGSPSLGTTTERLVVLELNRENVE